MSTVTTYTPPQLNKSWTTYSGQHVFKFEGCETFRTSKSYEYLVLVEWAEGRIMAVRGTSNYEVARKVKAKSYRYFIVRPNKDGSFRVWS